MLEAMKSVSSLAKEVVQMKSNQDNKGPKNKAYPRNESKFDGGFIEHDEQVQLKKKKNMKARNSIKI